MRRLIILLLTLALISYFSLLDSITIKQYQTNNDGIVNIAYCEDEFFIYNKDWKGIGQIQQSHYENIVGHWYTDNYDTYGFFQGYIEENKNDIFFEVKEKDGNKINYLYWSCLNKEIPFSTLIKLKFLTSIKSLRRKLNFYKSEFYNAEIIDNDIQSVEQLFALNSEMRNLADITWGISRHNKLRYAKHIYSWMNYNIQYDSKSNRYAAPRHIFNFRKGNCGETAALYGAFMKYKNIPWNFVLVKRDYKGKRVNHACSLIYIDGYEIQVDPVAYKSWDVKHVEYYKITDKKVVESFKDWNH